MERCGCEAHNSAVKASSQPIAIITLNRLNLLPSMDWTRLRLLRRYLNATILHGLFLSSLSDVLLLAFSDADWAGCPDDRRSTSGCLVYLGNSLVSWSSKKQPTMERSSSEAEYEALANAAAGLLRPSLVR